MNLRVDVYGHRVVATFEEADMDEVIRALGNMAKYENLTVEVEATGIGLPFAQMLEDWGVKVKQVRDGL